MTEPLPNLVEVVEDSNYAVVDKEDSDVLVIEPPDAVVVGQGLIGPQGPQGPAGPQGPPGTGLADLADVALSGSYIDLIDKPSIPTVESIDGLIDDSIAEHVQAGDPHPSYDDIPSLVLLFENGLV